jgi:transposase-like protein
LDSHWRTTSAFFHHEQYAWERSYEAKKKKPHTVEFKVKMALAAIEGDLTIAELVKKYDVHANQITDRKKQLLRNAIVYRLRLSLLTEGSIYHAISQQQVFVIVRANGVADRDFIVRAASARKKRGRQYWFRMFSSVGTIFRRSHDVGVYLKSENILEMESLQESQNVCNYYKHNMLILCQDADGEQCSKYEYFYEFTA